MWSAWSLPYRGRLGGLDFASLCAVQHGFARPATILLVEDNRPLRSLITRLLALGGAIVITESHGRDALEIGRQYGVAVDLLIADVQMSGQDGITLMLEFRALCPAILVLLITGFWNPRLEVLKQFGLHCLLKPFS